MASGELERSAQSRGEWPGCSTTFLLGFAGIELCVGGRARVEDIEGPRLGRGERVGVGRSNGERSGGCLAGIGFNFGGPRASDARCAEFSAGKEGGGGDELLGTALGEHRLADSATRSRVSSVSSDVTGGDFLKGGGGIATRSRCACFSNCKAFRSSTSSGSTCASSGGTSAVTKVSLVPRAAGRSHERNRHDEGGWL